MGNCYFCNIINNKLPSKTIYEDAILKVFMAKNPESNGHIIVVPKKHFNDFSEIDEKTLIHIFNTIKDLKSKLYECLNPYSLKIINNFNFLSPNHFHTHIIPDYEPKQPVVDIDIIYDKLK